ncbi:MAG TPA: hypothetical protein VMZ25_06165, partial [Terriglobales bacterium]|nr:hypothetical protein [Terriglobales bacterium]
MRLRPIVACCTFAILLPLLAAQEVAYRVIATNKTSTTQKEMNEAADAGFRFGGTMGGETSFGGSEVVTVMYRAAAADKGRYAYKLLA